MAKDQNQQPEDADQNDSVADTSSQPDVNLDRTIQLPDVEPEGEDDGTGTMELPQRSLENVDRTVSLPEKDADDFAESPDSFSQQESILGQTVQLPMDVEEEEDDGTGTTELPPRPAAGIDQTIPFAALEPNPGTGTAELADQQEAHFDRTVQLPPADEGDGTGTTELPPREDPNLQQTVQMGGDGGGELHSESGMFDRTVQIPEGQANEVEQINAGRARPGAATDLMQTVVGPDASAETPRPRDPRENERTINLGADSGDMTHALESEDDRAVWAKISSQSEVRSRYEPVVRAGHSSGMETNLLLLSRKLESPDPQQPGLITDYELIKLLGRGGMGAVYSARQASLDRTVAIKVIQPLSPADKAKLQASGRLDTAERTRREQFLSEAVVTGDLDHPNIVPIHDVAKTHEGDLFYSMKQVVGTPWDKVFSTKTLEENLEILLKVSDAVGFAHSRGVVHRDIKPENVMLGDFGVVMLMDWGLAVPTPEFKKVGTIRQATNLGGSPAYMAPELVVGPISVISPASDIYLLGAVLFQIVTGDPPHTASNLSQCIRAAAENRIIDVPKEQQGELYHIAIRAMATRQYERYRTVKDFQDAIRAYRSHSESISLSERATTDLAQAELSQEYGDFARAVFGFEEALELWAENQSARDGLREARLAYAHAAEKKEDLDLGLSLLNDGESDHQPVILRLKKGQRERNSRRSRLTSLRRIAALLLLVIFVGGGGLSFSLWQKNEELVSAIVSKENADRLKLEAESQAAVANLAKATALAEAQQAEQAAQSARVNAAKTVQAAEAKVATLDSQLADKQREVAMAEAHLRKAERDSRYETYLSQISLARTRIEQNQYDEARRILAGMEPKTTWEWKRLWYEVNRSQAAPSVLRGNPAGKSVVFGPSGTVALATFEDGSVELLNLSDDQETAVEQVPVKFAASAAAISPDEQQLVIAGTDGIIRIFDRKQQLRFELGRGTDAGHRDVITRVRCLTNRWLISGSLDKTLRLWDLEMKSEAAVAWHINPVLDVDAVRQQGKFVVVTASSDETNGRAVVWEVHPDAGTNAFTQRGDFLSHSVPVDAVAISPDAKTVASGDQGGHIFLWHVADVHPLDYQAALVAAIDSVKNNTPTESAEKPVPYEELSDPELLPGVMHLVSTEQANAHMGAVDGLRFQADGSRLVSASDDFTLKVWDLSKRTLWRTLRGHGGRVQAAGFSPTDSNLLLSAGNTGLRRWNLASRDEEIIQRPADLETDQIRAHDDEIWSARFDASGHRLVTASRDHTSRVLEIDPQTLKFEEIASFRNDELAESDGEAGLLQEGGGYVSLSMVPDEKFTRLIVGGSDGVVRVWDVARATELAVLPNTGLNSSLAMSRDGRLVLTGSSDPKVRAQLWTLDAQGQPVAPPRIIADEVHQPVTAFAVSADGRLLFTGGKQGECLVWNAESGKVQQTLRPHATSRINAAVFSKDGSQLFLASDDRTVSRTDLKSGDMDSLNHDGYVTDVSLSPDARHLLSVVQVPRANETGKTESLSESRLILWTLSPAGGTSRTLWTEPQNGAIRSVRFSFDSGLALTTHVNATGQRSEVRAWQINPTGEPALLHTFRFPDAIASAECAIPMTGGKMFSLNGDAAFLWELQSRGHLLSYRAHGAVTEAAFSPSGKFVTSGSRSVKIWDVTTQKSICKLEFPHQGSVRSTQFSPLSDQIFATAGDDGQAALWEWDPKTGDARKLRAFHVCDGVVHRVRFSPDGQRLLAVGDAGAATLWNVDGTGQPVPLSDPKAGNANYLSGEFSADGRLVVVGASDRIARLWKFDGQKAELIKTLQGHADQIEDVAFLPAPDGNPEHLRVVTASRDKSVRIWDPKLEDASAPREILSLRRHTLGVTAVDVAKEGELLMTAGLDGNVILWPCEMHGSDSKP